jgi:pyruvate/2-oxoglutarate/acetoin dehydrogenase E1 component
MGAVLNYIGELTRAMSMLACDERTVFVGQSVKYDGQVMHKTFAGVPMEQRIEMPVAEDFQMGFCTGLSLAGKIPICSYPRMDFLILAMNQLANHLDKIPLMSEFRPKVIIRVAVGNNTPLDPGPQHRQDHSHALELMLQNIPVVRLLLASDVYPSYERAMHSNTSTVLVEYMKNYDYKQDLRA